MFAIIESGGKQYKVEENKPLEVEKIKNIEPGQKIAFDKVLLFFDGKKTEIGSPYLEGLTVEAEVVEQKKSKKIIVFRYKSKTRYRKKKSQRRYTTKLKVSKISSK